MPIKGQNKFDSFCLASLFQRESCLVKIFLLTRFSVFSVITIGSRSWGWLLFSHFCVMRVYTCILKIYFVVGLICFIVFHLIILVSSTSISESWWNQTQKAIHLHDFFFFSQYWKLFPAACTEVDWAGKQTNNDFFQVLHNVMNRPSVYYYLLSIFVYMPFPSLKLAFLGFLKLYAMCEIIALFQEVQ